MIAWSRRHTLIAGIALIAATNAVALVGVAYNRSGDPDALLKLSQRELRLPYIWGFEGENSGIALGLQWRVLGAETDDSQVRNLSYFNGGVPAWLDKFKLAALGFEVPPTVDTTDPRRRYEKQLPREVLLVLELDGPVYQRALERARKFAADEAALLAANPDRQEFKRRASSAQDQLEREERDNTRLFVVDVGLDAAVVRKAYPERTRYALVRGEIRPLVVRTDGQARATGYISGLEIEQINVPLAFRPVFEPLVQNQRRGQYKGAFEVTVAFGKRLEPWITAASAKAGAE